MHSRVKGINEIQATRADLEKKENQTALNTSERKNDEVGIRVSTLRSNEICALFRWNEREESRCREATLLAKDDWGCGPQRDVDSGVLSGAPLEGKPVLLVATQTEDPPSGTEQADLLGRSSKLCAGQ